MKICFMAPASNIHTVRWVNAMDELGHEVHVITMHPPKLNPFHSSVQVHVLKIPAPFGYYLNVLEVKKLLFKIKPDVLHTHYATGYGTLSRLVNYEPTLLSVWGSDVYIYPNESSRKAKRLRKSLAAATHITSTSHDMKKETIKYVSPSNPIDVVPFGIDLQTFKSIDSVIRDEIVIGTVRHLEHIYGIDILIKSVAKLIAELQQSNMDHIAKKIRLLIVGNGSLEKELHDLAEQEGISNITTFVGAVPNEKVPSYLNKMDLFCALSRSESFGVAVIEASACEVPVIVSNVGGLPEVVLDGKTGYIVEAEATDEVAEKLQELVLDEELRIRMGKDGRLFVQNQFDWKQNVKQMEQIYSKVIDRRLPSKS